jgi:hypothetical protein
MAIARRDMLRRKRAELDRSPHVQKWKRMTQEDRAKAVIEIMTKNHMEHARLLGRFQSEEKLRERLAALAVSYDSLQRPEL